MSSLKKAEEAEKAKVAAIVELEEALYKLKYELKCEGRVKEEFCRRLNESKVEEKAVKSALAEKEKEVTELKLALTAARDEIVGLKEEFKALEAFTRLKTRASIMHQHLAGKNPLKDAKEELSFFLQSVGTEDDQKSDDDEVFEDISY